MGDTTMMMGDLVLTESEINPVMAKLLSEGVQITRSPLLNSATALTGARAATRQAAAPEADAMRSCPKRPA